MRLEEIDLKPYGRFTEGTCGFRIERYHLEEPWSYIYTTPNILLKLDQRGPDYAQFVPPGGSVLFRRERFQKSPSWMVWITLEDGSAFTNFWGPATGRFSSLDEPDEFICEYRPEKATYTVTQDSIKCETEIFIPLEEPVVVMACRITNTGSDSKTVDVVPVLRPHFAASSLAPWDVPALYQKVGYSNDGGDDLFLMELRSPAGIPELREYGFVLSDFQAESSQVNYASFVGNGSFENPEALKCESLEITGSFTFGDYSPANSVNGEQGSAAMRKRISLRPGETFEFTTVIGSAGLDAHGIPPSREQITSYRTFFWTALQERIQGLVRRNILDFVRKREIRTPDEAFDRYANEFLPLQLKWVSVLDRGWPTGMRGVRDNSQDMTAMVPLDTDTARNTLLKLFEVQRSDGWFPRQYSVKGRKGSHDLRNYVDGGVWVWELLYDYLCFSKDSALLNERLPFLDSDEESSILDHVFQLIDYYLDKTNVGEHGLCLIREGDWNDSVNRAGLEGRGESVMVSCQVVMMLKQAAALCDYLDQGSASAYREQANILKDNILSHALNEEGYLNGYFTDNGEWVFSPDDPDGCRRINIPVNAFGIISGVLTGETASKVIDVLIGMKQTDGWPLFYPAIGEPPISNLGRIGQGDLAPGLGENGTPYNHGCHGFFGRAAAVLGRGDLLLEIMRYMLPYEQDCHPVGRSKTAPYGVVNHWKTAPGQDGKGGDCFLSGSISTGLRNIYNGMFGIKPMLDGLALNPCLPSGWPEASVRFSYLGADVIVTYRNVYELNDLTIKVNGESITTKTVDLVTGEDLRFIPDEVFQSGERYEIQVG